MKYLIGCVLSFMVGCGPKSSTHTVQGEATVRVVVGVDVTACEKLPVEDQAECIEALIELAKAIQEDQDDNEPVGFGGI